MLNWQQLTDYLLAGGKITLSANPTADKPFRLVCSRVFDGMGSAHETPEELAEAINGVTKIVNEGKTNAVVSKIKEARAVIADVKKAIVTNEPFSTILQ